MYPYKILPAQEFNTLLDDVICRYRGDFFSLIIINIADNLNITILINNIISSFKKKFQITQFYFKVIERTPNQYYIICSEKELQGNNIKVNLSSFFGKFKNDIEKSNNLIFSYGISYANCDYLLEPMQIFKPLERLALLNLNNNEARWAWTNLIFLQNYISKEINEDTIELQPIFKYNPKNKNFSIASCEVFLGHHIYKGYQDLMNRIPHLYSSKECIELLIFEKMLIACKNLNDIVLKFNISPQLLINFFPDDLKVQRFKSFIKTFKLNPKTICFELLEYYFADKQMSKLQEVCHTLSSHGYTFSLDDFGVDNSNHMIILNLGDMIKEIKINTNSYNLKANKDSIAYKDSIAFFAYCKKLSESRNAIITIEALEDPSLVSFFLENNMYYFQSHLFSKKVKVKDLKKMISSNLQIPLEEVLKQKNN